METSFNLPFDIVRLPNRREQSASEGLDMTDAEGDSPVVKVDRFPVRVHSSVELATVRVEFVREDQLVLFAVEASPCERFFRSVGVDQASVRRHFRDL